MSERINRTGRLREEVEGFDPGSFALVMATGIVSIAAFTLGYAFIAWVLLAINVAAYLVLWMATLARLALAPNRLFRDLRTHQKGPAFFTLPAGSCVLGSQVLILTDVRDVTAMLWVIGAAAWLVLIYAFFFIATIGEGKPTLERGINGTWLVAIVATQSVSELGTVLAGDLSTPQTLLFGTLSLFLLGCALYVFIIALILYRFLFLPLNAEELTPPYWITMGAEAITTFSTTTLIRHASQWSEPGR